MTVSAESDKSRDALPQARPVGVRSDGPEGITCWFIDTNYNEDAWTTLHSDTSRPFDKPKSGRIAVKVTTHLDDEVLKVIRV